ncbi:MAG: phage portal protein [Porphyromonadaceae bacterium]|nr:phage portal protein [Porphyromonadaceae bacterium]
MRGRACSQGGNKKGYLTSEKKVDKDVIDGLKESFRNQYSNNAENVIVLNQGLQFKESSNTAVEMQLNESKVSNAAEIGKIFHMSPNLLNGSSSAIKPEEEIQKFVKLAVLPIMKIIESALNEDLLLEKEKKSFYFAFETKELLKGTAKERFETYKTAIDSKVMTIDEARYQEDMKPLGLDFINLGLGAVLYNTKTKEVFIANTNTSVDMKNLKGGEKIENRDTE